MVWTVGQDDGCVIFEAPDESKAANLLVNLAKDGNVQTETMRCDDHGEFESVLKTG